MSSSFKIFTGLFLLYCFNTYAIPTYYCTAADEKFYLLVENLIGSIHKNDPNVEEIAVYNLGFTKNQIRRLGRYHKVKVYDVEKSNPDIFEPILTSDSGRKVRGLFSWKHVVLKQASERFPYFLYLDAGVSILNDPQIIFDHINNEGYFFLSLENHHMLNIRMTKNVLDNVIDIYYPEYKKSLMSASTTFHGANVQGISQKIYQSYVIPLYNFSKNIEFYRDDGSASLGYGSARHDQTLSSILIHVNNFYKFPQGFITFPSDLNKPIHCHWDEIYDDQTIILLSQKGAVYKGGFRKYIKKGA